MLECYEKVKHFKSYHYLLPNIADVLKNSVVAYDDRVDDYNIYCSARCPDLTIDQFLSRFVKYLHCTPQCFVNMIINLRKFFYNNPSIGLHNKNIHRLISIALVVSIKMRDDLAYYNKFYARVIGVSLEELNLMEVYFLYGISWRLFITENMFLCTVSRLSNNTYSIF